MPEPLFDPASAARVHFVDPRVRQLASARWRLMTGGTHQQWLALGKDHPEAQIREARDWVRAAVAAGLLPAPGQPADDPTLPPTLLKAPGVPSLRELVAELLGAPNMKAGDRGTDGRTA